MERYDIIETMSILANSKNVLQAVSLIGNSDVKNTFKAVESELFRLKRLYDESEAGERELFLAEHQPRYDQMDGIYDCSSSSCPSVGFHSKEDKEHHYKMWGIKLEGI